MAQQKAITAIIRSSGAHARAQRDAASGTDLFPVKAAEAIAYAEIVPETCGPYATPDKVRTFIAEQYAALGRAQSSPAYKIGYRTALTCVSGLLDLDIWE